MALTPEQKKRLAKEARRLAMECVRGTAPAFGTGTELNGVDGGPNCVLGHVYCRAEPPLAKHMHTQLFTLTDWPNPEWSVVTAANDYYPPAQRQAAVVFPLLALADALEQ